MKNLIAFLQKQKLLTLALGGADDIWAANVYFATDDEGTMYFISTQNNKHSKMIITQPRIAFATAWFDPQNHKNRKGVQGVGECRVAHGAKETATGIALLYKAFPDLRDILTVKWIMENAWGTRVWVVKPSLMKYWDDELYGDDEAREFTFPAA